jgi:hypothetical protein
LGCANTSQNTTNTSSITGTFSTEPLPGQTGLRLKCESDTQCTLQVMSAKNPNSVFETRLLPSVSKLQNMEQVENSLAYAKAKLSKPPVNPSADLAAARIYLAPLSNISLNQNNCYDLGSREGNEYHVVCRVPQSHWSRPTVLFFATQMSSCGILFCRYMILPMFPSENVK